MKRNKKIKKIGTWEDNVTIPKAIYFYLEIEKKSQLY